MNPKRPAAMDDGSRLGRTRSCLCIGVTAFTLSLVGAVLFVLAAVHSPALQKELVFLNRAANFLFALAGPCNLHDPARPRMGAAAILGLYSCEGLVEAHQIEPSTWSSLMDRQDGPALGVWHYRPHAECGSEGEAYKVVLYFHGNGETRAWAPAVRKFQLLTRPAYCWHVVTFDYRGFGDSGGSPTESGLVDDGLRALEWVVRRKPSAVLLLGHSLGSGVAVAVAEQLCRREGRRLEHGSAAGAGVPASRITLLVEGAFTSIADMPAYWLERYGLPRVAAHVRNALNRSAPHFNSLGRVRSGALDCLAALHSIHGDADGVVSVALGESLHGAARLRFDGRSQFLRVRGAAHENALSSLLASGDERLAALLRAAASVRFGAEQPPPPRAPPPMGRMLGAPPPPPPKLVGGLRSLLDGIEGCGAPCCERAEDWFEHAAKWGATNVVDVVRLELVDLFVGALALGHRAAEEMVRERLAHISTTIVPETVPSARDEL